MHGQVKPKRTVFPNNSSADEEAWAIELVRSVRDGESTLAEARISLIGKLEKSPSSKTFLCELADLEYNDRHFERAISYMSRAVTSYPEDAEIVARYAYLLCDTGYFREALDVLSELGDMRTAPIVRRTLGDIYWRMRWYAKAVNAYGTQDRPLRALLWLVTHPTPRIRHSVLRANNRAERTWRSWTEKQSLSEILEPLGYTGKEIQAEVDYFNLRWIQIGFLGWFGETAWVWARRLALVVLTCIVWVSLLLMFRLIEPGIHRQFAASQWALPGIVVATFGWYAIYKVANLTVSHHGERLVWISSAMIFTIVGSLVTLAGVVSAPGKGWHLASIGIGLLAAPLLAVLVYGAPLIVRVWYLGELKELYDKWPRATLLDALGDLIDEISNKENRHSLEMRARWIDILEQRAASILVRSFPDFLIPSTKEREDPEACQRARVWANRAAAAFRQLKQEIATPKPGSWEQVESVLREQATLVANGDFGALKCPATEELPTGDQGKQYLESWGNEEHLRRRGISLVRQAVAAIFPLGMSFLIIFLHPVLGISADTVRWITAASVVWLVYSVLYDLDPELRRKAEIVGGVTSDLSQVVGKTVPRAKGS